jgi:hypothetical protein
MVKPHPVKSRKADETALVQSLVELTRRFSRTTSLKKIRLLAALKDRPIRNGALLRQLYDALCFIRAYPNDAHLLAIIDESLGAFPRRLESLQDSGAQPEVMALDGSSAMGTTVHCAFSLPIAQWLVDRFAETVEIDWDQPETENCLACIFSMSSGPVAEEPLVEADTSYRSWVKVHKGNRSISDLQWLLDLLEVKIPDGQVRRAFFDRLRLFIRWELREGHLLEKANNESRQPVYFQEGPLVRPGLELPHSLPGEPVTVRPVNSLEATELIDMARMAVAVRHRETHAFNYANPQDALVADLGRGIRIAWFGVLPEHRLPLRALFGFLILKNGVPVGYGDAALLFDWIDGGGGISIFEAFRNGESMFIFHRFTAFLNQHLGIRAIHISRWDIGHDNPDGIESRAFWFYYRLGFRPKHEGLRQLAARENRRIRQERGYRSSRKTLEELSQAGMFIGLDEDVDSSVRDFDTRRVSQRAAALVAQMGPEKLTAELADMIGAENWQTWVQSERLAFERLAPVLALIPDLHCWPSSERRAIVDLIRAKAGRHEAEYLRLLAGLPRLRAVILGLGAPHT